jgi:hypothetical protein
MGVWLYNDGRIKYYPAALQDWPRLPWDINKIVQTMEQLAEKYRKARL